MSTSPRSPGAPGGELDLTGRRALVSGGTRGIGAATASLLSTRGAHVLVVARTEPEAATGTGVSFVAADVATPAGAQKVAEAVQRDLGGIDIVVHSAGASFARAGGALALTDDDWKQSLDTNLMSAVRIDRVLAPIMVKQRRGAVVHISSLQWRRPHPSSPAYGPAKAALTNYSKVLAEELASWRPYVPLLLDLVRDVSNAQRRPSAGSSANSNGPTSCSLAR